MLTFLFVARYDPCLGNLDMRLENTQDLTHGFSSVRTEVATSIVIQKFALK